MLTVETLTEAIDLAKQGRESMTKCLAHDDGTASLHISPGHSQPVILKCHAGCDMGAVLDAAGVDPSLILAPREESDFGTDRDMWTPAGQASDRYPYTDEEGTVLYEVLRIPLPGGKKTFRQRIQDPDNPGRWKYSLGDTRRVLYRLPQVLAAMREGRVIWLVEGERDVHSLEELGEVATTSPMGAGKWKDEFSQALSGASVNIIADKDDAGRNHARQVRESLESYGATCATYEASGTAKDVTDHLLAGRGLEELLETAPETVRQQVKAGIDVVEAIKREFPPNAFVIPGTLSEGERVMITGLEGGGKSQLLRQLAVQVAAGIHPFNGSHVPAKKVLYIDSENHPQQVLESWQDLVGLAARHGRPMEPDHLFILEEWETQPAITTPSGRDWLVERIHAFRPDLICMGPLYVMSDKDLRSDDVVTALIKAVNYARGLYGTAFIMEHHSPHKGPNDAKRSVRPYGHSSLMRWPDFGFGLQPMESQEGSFEFIRTRGMRVRDREWPEYMRWGKPNTDEWSWLPAEEDEFGNIH